MATMKDYILELLAEQPNLPNEAVAELVRKKFKGANTSAASVASVKSMARRAGTLPEAPLVDTTPDTTDVPDTSEEPEEAIRARLSKRFNTMDRMIAGIIKGIVPSLIISGPAGLGKSFPVEQALEAHKAEDENFTFDIIKGSASAVGLYIALYRMSEGGVLVIDDADDVFRDETALNILKGALDSNGKRIISWRKQAHWLEEQDIPDRFEFAGQVVFLTNIDFEAQVLKGGSTAPHFKALMDRSLYLGLTLRTLQDYMVRIRMVIEGGMLDKYDFAREQKDEILAFVDEHRRRFYHLSLRLIHQIALCRLADEENWKDDVEMTKMRVV